MNEKRKAGIIVGVLFLVALFSDIISVSITADKSLWVGVMLLDLISGVSVIGIGLVVFGVLKSRNKNLALSYTVIRIVEGIFFIVMAIILLCRMTSSGISTSTNMIDMVYVYIFCLGALIFYYLLWETKLIPRFISGWGILAILILLVLNVMGILQTDSVVTVVLAAPIALQEFVMGIWLIVKGFR